MYSSKLALHPRLCSHNFWDNSCHSAKCTLLHIRRPGRKLVLFNACANLHRISRKMGSTVLASMQMPTDCELHVVDSQIDPEDFGSSLSFYSKSVYVARAIGLHPSIGAPTSYFSAFKTGLLSLDRTQSLAYTGPFGGSPSIKHEEHYDVQAMAVSLAGDTHGLRATALGHQEEAFLQGPDLLRLPGPALFLSAGRNSSEQLTTVVRTLKKCTNVFVSYNGDALRNSYNTREHLLSVLSSTPGRRCVLETASASSRSATKNDFLPLAIVNVIVDLYVNLQERRVRHAHNRLDFTLAEFNTLFNENGFSLVPLTHFHAYHSSVTLGLFDKAVRDTLGAAFRRHRNAISSAGKSSVPQTPSSSTHAPTRLGATTPLIDLTGFAPGPVGQASSWHQLLVNSPGLFEALGKVVSAALPGLAPTTITPGNTRVTQVAETLPPQTAAEGTLTLDTSEHECNLDKSNSSELDRVFGHDSDDCEVLNAPDISYSDDSDSADPLASCVTLLPKASTVTTSCSKKRPLSNVTNKTPVVLESASAKSPTSLINSCKSRSLLVCIERLSDTAVAAAVSARPNKKRKTFPNLATATPEEFEKFLDGGPY